MWQGEPAYVKTASALHLRKSLLSHSPSTASGPPPSQREADKAVALATHGGKEENFATSRPVSF